LNLPSWLVYAFVCRISLLLVLSMIANSSYLIWRVLTQFFSFLSIRDLNSRLDSRKILMHWGFCVMMSIYIPFSYITSNVVSWAVISWSKFQSREHVGWVGSDGPTIPRKHSLWKWVFPTLPLVFLFLCCCFALTVCFLRVHNYNTSSRTKGRDYYCSHSLRSSRVRKVKWINLNKFYTIWIRYVVQENAKDCGWYKFWT